MKQIVKLLVIAAMPICAFADGKFVNGKSSYVSTNRYLEDRLEEQEHEIRKLTNKIELLEHKISTLAKQLSVEGVNAAVIDQVVVPERSGGPDIFDTASLATMNYHSSSSNTSRVHSIEKKDVAPDKQMYDLALATFKSNEFVEAEQKFAKFIQKYPNSKMISNAYFWYGETFFKQKNFNAAAINYLKCYKQAPKGDKASDGLLKLALSLGELNKKQEACDMLRKLDKEFPKNRSVSSKKATEDAKLKFGCKRAVK